MKGLVLFALAMFSLASSACYAGDWKRLCLAYAAGGGTDSLYQCGEIQRTDLYGLCVGTVIGRTYCSGISNSDIKNLCFANTSISSGEDIAASYCKTIRDTDLRNLCFGEITSDEHSARGYCDAIKNADLLNLCYSVLSPDGASSRSFCQKINN